MEAKYFTATNFVVNVSGVEFELAFVDVRQNVPIAKDAINVLLHPIVAKQLMRVLQEKVAGYESALGVLPDLAPKQTVVMSAEPRDTQ